MQSSAPSCAFEGQAMRKALDVMYEASGALAALCLLAILVLMISQSFLRQFGISTAPVNDLVAWSCSSAAFLGMAYSFRHGDFVRVTLLVDSLRPATRRRVELCCLTLAAIATGYLAWSVTHFVYESWKFEDVTQGLVVVPLWIPQASFATGSAISFVAVVDELVRVARGSVPNYVEAVKRRHARGDFSSDV